MGELSTTCAVESLIALLQKCRQEKDPSQARRLHAYLRQHQLESHRVLGNFLVPMLVDCGCLPDAQHAFDQLAQRNEYSWCSLILGYINDGRSQHALVLYEKMQRDCVRPNSHSYLALLRACSLLQDSVTGLALHAEIAKGGLDASRIVGNSLMDMYGKCGFLSEAIYVFNKLPDRDVISWNALIAVYAEHGLGDEAQNCFVRMQLEGNAPDDVTCLCSLKACGSVGALETGKIIHSSICKSGLEREVFLSTTLVDMYAKCDSLADARGVFDMLAVRGAVSWNVLIAGYADHGFGEEALKCFKQMELEGICPVPATYLCALKACGTMKGLEAGEKIHSEIFRRGLETELFVSTTLLDMYAKCGALAEAQRLLYRMPDPGAVSWTALVAGYLEQGLGQEALDCVKNMQLEGTPLVAVTCVCSLKACSITGTLESGEATHTEVLKRGWERELDVHNALVDMYARCGSLVDAQELFSQISSRNTVPWTALIAGYVDHGLDYKALNCYDQMQLEGVSPDANTIVCILKSCGMVQAFEKAAEVHVDIYKRGLEGEPYVGHTLLDVYVKCGLLVEAQKVFDRLPARGAVSWSALIAGYAEHEFGEEVLDCFTQMQVEGVSPVAVTFACSFKACGVVGALETGKEIHAETTKKGLESDLFVGSSAVDMYAKCGLLAEAKEVFDNLPIRDVAAWNAMIKGFGENHEGSKAVRCFEDMQEQGVRADGITLTCLLAACSHSSLIFEGQKYFKAMVEVHHIELTLDHFNCMVDLFARSGHIHEAGRFAQGMQCLQATKIVRAMLGACKIYGEVELGLRYFNLLVELNEEDASSYLLLADIYSVAGGWSDAKRIEETRTFIAAKKKPGSVTIELNKTLYKFVVGDDHSKSALAMLETVNSRLKDGGHVPNPD